MRGRGLADAVRAVEEGTAEYGTDGGAPSCLGRCAFGVFLRGCWPGAPGGTRGWIGSDLVYCVL